MPDSIKFSFALALFILFSVLHAAAGMNNDDSQNTLTSENNNPRAENGILDLRNFRFDKHPVIVLKGEWEFYWNKFVPADAFKEDIFPKADFYCSVPGYWTNYLFNGKKLPGTGYCSYRLRILLPENFKKELALDVPVFDSSFELFINGNFAGSNGIIGTSESSSKGFYAPFITRFQPAGNFLDILVHVSNFEHRRGGFWKTMKIGIPEKIDRVNKVKMLISNLSLGVLISFSLFFLFFFLFHKEERISLYFSLSLFGIFIRLFSTGFYSILLIFRLPWVTLIRLEYLGTYIGFIFMCWYLFALYPSAFRKKLAQAITLIFGASSIVILFTRISIFSYTMIPFQFLAIGMIIYYLVILFINVLKKKPDSLMYFLGLFFLSIALVNDILHANSRNAVFSDYMMHIAFQIFIFIQAILLIKSWIVAYEEKERLHKELDFKNKVFSIIAHDLRNPVMSLDQFLTVINNKNISQDKKERALNSIQSMMKSSVTLIDNLLFWGRSQASQIYAKPQACNLMDVSLDIINLFKGSAGYKSLSFSCNAEGDPHAYCDTELIRIVIRNLISNAVKFTKPEGHIYIRIYHKPEFKNQIFLDVEDDGVGISDARLKNIFSKEGLVSTYGTALEKGTGIGLNLCFDLVNLNNGNLEIKSKENSGTRIMLTLPSYISSK